MRSRSLAVPFLVIGSTALLIGSGLLLNTVPTDIQMPGTQPTDTIPPLGAASGCDNCHGGYDPAAEPAHNWRGSMMAHAGRDPLFWAAVAVAEQGFPGSGDLCLRCHAPKGWFKGRSTPTDGSSLANGDADGVECSICHKLVDPSGLEHAGVQAAPFIANDGETPPTGYYGSGMMVLTPTGDRFGPYGNAVASHQTSQSAFHRSSDFCGTCHDVSNPAVGDLAPGNGAQVPLPTGKFSGTLGSPVQTKAAFNNFPHQYGAVERTYSEHVSSALVTTPVSSYASLPAELKAGSIEAAWQAATATTPTGDYVDGATRSFTCQTCHMPPAPGKGCGMQSAPFRNDNPLHEMVGGNYWVPDLIQYMDNQGTLVFGGGLTSDEKAGLIAGKLTARAQLEEAAGLSVTGDDVRIVNLTGHKVITGFPEGRRMWLNVKWYDAGGRLLREDGAYGPLAVQIDGNPATVSTLITLDDPNTRVYQAKPGITQAWAAKLIAQNVHPASLPVAYDRLTGSVTMTLGQIATASPGSAFPTFRFVLNDTFVSDNRIPPYLMRYNDARARSCLPVPETLYGNPGPGGTYDHFDVFPLNPPPRALKATIDLLYQPTSWEYIQFLYLANDGLNAFLGTTGTDLLAGWQATGMAAPHVMASATWRSIRARPSPPVGTFRAR